MAISKTPVKINRIKEILPHRYPFLLVDRVIELTESKIVAFKNLTANEEFFRMVTSRWHPSCQEFSR